MRFYTNVHEAYCGIDLQPRLASWAACKTPTFLGHTFRRLSGPLGGKKAAMAVAHKVLVPGYHLLLERTCYDNDEWYDRLQARHAVIRELGPQFERETLMVSRINDGDPHGRKENTMEWARREFITSISAAVLAQIGSGAKTRDRVIFCNEDSNTLSVIDPNTNTVATTINLTSFDEDPRPPFRLVTGGVTPTHAAMVTKPLYHGAINIHGAAPSPDNKLLACTGRGTSNVYLLDLETMKLIRNTPNPQAGAQTNAERLTSGVLVGREPHEPTFSRNGKEIWVTIRGENRIAILDTVAAIKEAGGAAARAVRR